MKRTVTGRNNMIKSAGGIMSRAEIGESITRQVTVVDNKIIIQYKFIKIGPLFPLLGSALKSPIKMT